MQKNIARLLLKSVIALSLALASQSARSACDYSDAALYNGWGWDPVARDSCPPLDECDYSNANIYGGWGWNPGTQMSCPPLMPTAGVCIDSDGDGWGWDGVNSCPINNQPNPADRLIFVEVPGSATAYRYSLTVDGASSVFQYWGQDLYSGDTGESDIFVLDNNSGQLKLLTVGEGGAKANNDSYLRGVSDDGNTALISSRVTNFANTSANGVQQPYLLDVATGTVTQILASSPWSNVTSVLSSNGNYVAFSTYSGNVVTGDRNAASDVFLFNVAAGTTNRVNLTDSGEELFGRATVRDISGDGRYVLFSYQANYQTATPEPWPSGLYIHDRIEQTNKAVRYFRDADQPAAISYDGSIVAYQYSRPTGAALAWINTQTGDVGPIDAGGAGSSVDPRVSPNGKYVVYKSWNTDLVDDVNVSGERAQIYLTEISTGKTVLISQSPDGQEANGYNGQPDFIAAGNYIRFTSYASNLHSEDTDKNDDVFLFKMPAQ